MGPFQFPAMRRYSRSGAFQTQIPRSGMYPNRRPSYHLGRAVGSAVDAAMISPPGIWAFDKAFKGVLLAGKKLIGR